MVKYLITGSDVVLVSLSYLFNFTMNRTAFPGWHTCLIRK